MRGKIFAGFRLVQSASDYKFCHGRRYESDSGGCEVGLCPLACYQEVAGRSG